MVHVKDPNHHHAYIVPPIKYPDGEEIEENHPLVSSSFEHNPADTRRNDNVTMTLKRRRDVFWRHNDVIIAPCARWELISLASWIS